MNPFHDVGQRCGGPLPAVAAPSRSFSGPAPAAETLPDADNEIPDISLSRFAWMLSLGVLGLAGLLTLGVGGVALVQGYAFRGSSGIQQLTGTVRREEKLSVRVDARRGTGASPWATAGADESARSGKAVATRAGKTYLPELHR